jgi:hypothetical protein
MKLAIARSMEFRPCWLVTLACATVALHGCGAGDPGESPDISIVAGEPAGPSSFSGCVVATGRPDLFLLSVSDYVPDQTRFDEPGSIVPREGPDPAPWGPAGSIPGPPPVQASPGTRAPSGPPALPAPGDRGEVTPWTPTTVVYELAGDGGLALADHVGHRIDVVGRLGEDGKRLIVDSARDVSEVCLPTDDPSPSVP